MRTDWYHYGTHCVVSGTSQSGKSKFCEDCIRAHIRAGHGVFVLDWHGTLYDGLVDYLAYFQPQVPVYLFNFSSPNLVMLFNPFALPTGRDISSHVSRLTAAFIKPWAGNVNEMPMYDWIVRMVLWYMAETGEPLHHAVKLLDFTRTDLRQRAIGQIKDEEVREHWMGLQCITKLAEWNAMVGSTQRRLNRFVGSRAIRVFTGHRGPGVSIAQCIEENAIVLVNSKPSHFLSPESGKTIAGLFVSELLDAAIDNMGDPKPYFAYWDECQNYMTSDAAEMLDQTLKSGLRLTLIHHHAGQFRKLPEVLDSMEMNAKCKVVFAGLPVPAAKYQAEEFFLPELNERWMKELRYRYFTEYEEEPYFSSSDTMRDVPDGNPLMSYTSSYGTRYRPVQRKEVDGQEDWGREEKVSQLAARFLSLTRGECYIKTPDQVYRHRVPWVHAYLHNPVAALEYEKSLSPYAIPLSEAESRLASEVRRFLERSSHAPARTKKKPAHLHTEN